jgi:hypothetical protein
VSDSELVEMALGSWATMNAVLTKLTRRQLAVLIKSELEFKRRPDIIKRLYQRLTRVRARSELAALLTANARLVEGDNSTDVLTTHGLTWLYEELSRQEHRKKRT